MEATFWHYALAFPLLGVLGSLMHCLRSWITILLQDVDLASLRPHFIDRSTFSFLTNNHAIWDRGAGKDELDKPSYEFFSRRNWRNMCLWTVAIGYALLLGYPELERGYVLVVNSAPRWIWDLIKYRIENLRLL